MKVIVMSDTHLRYVTPEFENLCDKFCKDADMVIHLGDWVSPQILDYMMQFNIVGVSGNSDHPGIVAQLPFKKTIKLESFRFGLVHGWEWSGNLYTALTAEFDGVDGIFFGHTHRPCFEKVGKMLFLNPGSVFAGRGHVKRSLAVVNVIGETINVNIVSL